MKKQTTRIQLKVFVDSNTGKPIFIDVPNGKVKELRAMGRSAKKQGKALRIALDKAIKEDLPSEVLPGGNDAGHCRIAKPSDTYQYFSKRFKEFQ